MSIFTSQTHWSLTALFLVLSALSISVEAQSQTDPLSNFDLKQDLPSLADLQKLAFTWMITSGALDSSQCVSFVNDIYNHPNKYMEPFMATGKRLNDYGDPFACRRLKNFTYLIFMIKDQNSTNRGLIGFCSPSKCKVEDFKKQEASIKSTISKIIGPETTSFDIVFTDPQAEEDNLETDIYTYLAFLIMGTIVVLGTLGTFYDIQGEKNSHGRSLQNPRKTAAPTTVEFSDTSNLSSKHSRITLETSIDSESETEPNGTQLNEKLPMGEVLLNEEPRVASDKPRLNFQNFCKCFSFYTNGKKLFSTNKISDDVASTECLNGFRVMNMLWVILGHTFYYHIRAPLLNLKEWLPFIRNPRNQILVACPLSVDSFLFLGGFLGAYLMLKEVRKRKGRINVIQVWVHRVYRIVPLYLLVLLFGWKIMPQFIFGVGGYNYKELVDADCKDTWWANIAFVNNYLPVGRTSACFGHSWYLSVDMQVFLPLPILLMLYYKNRTAGWITVLALFFGSILLWLSASLIHGWGCDLPWVLEHLQEYFEFYDKPYYRYGPYGLGIISGILISEYKDESLGHNIFAKKLYRFWRNRMMRYLTYLIGITIISWSIYIHYPINNGDASKWSQFTQSLFMATQRSIWVFGWILLFMPAMMGWGTFLRGVLGASFWSPLTRLTFGAYLIHPILQVWYYWQLEQGWSIGVLNSLINCVGFATASYLLSSCFSLMAESPFMNLERFLMPQKRPREVSIKESNA